MKTKTPHGKWVGEVIFNNIFVNIYDFINCHLAHVCAIVVQGKHLTYREKE